MWLLYLEVAILVVLFFALLASLVVRRLVRRSALG